MRHFHSPPGRENAHQHKEYATVRAVLANRSDKGALLLTNDKLVVPVWVPPQALDSRGKIAAARAPLKSEVEIGVELNMAIAKGLV